MGGRCANRAHLVEYNAATAPGELPGRLAPRESAANHMHRRIPVFRHALRIARQGRATRRVRLARAGQVIAFMCLATACSRSAVPETAARPEEAWIAATCLPAAPDIAGWKLHQFADLVIAVPPEFTVRSPTPRSVEFVHGSSQLTLLVSPSATRQIFYPAGRPALAKEEAACESRIAGFPGVVSATARANTFSVTAEWDGEPLWGPTDWRKRLVARVQSGRLREAAMLRDALHTIRLARDSTFEVQRQAAGSRTDGWR